MEAMEQWANHIDEPDATPAWLGAEVMRLRGCLKVLGYKTTLSVDEAASARALQDAADAVARDAVLALTAVRAEIEGLDRIAFPAPMHLRGALAKIKALVEGDGQGTGDLPPIGGKCDSREEANDGRTLYQDRVVPDADDGGLRPGR